MKLDRLILVNWGQLRPGNFEMGDMTLLTGETGSGKSTLLDALQTVMTGANKTILNYNPGQEEVTQGQRRGKTKRTLESYIVGAEYNNFSRAQGAQGYMAAVFRPSKGEEHLKPFTALVAAAARVEGAGETRQAKLESSALVIVDDAALSVEDFFKDVGQTECVSVEHIARHLQSKYPRVHDYHDKKNDYLCALFGRFRGKSNVTRDEATNAAKAWVQSIAYRPIGSVHELVRDEILDFDEKQLQQDIERIGGLMRQVSNLRQESIRLQANVTQLTELQFAINEANRAFEAHASQEFLVAKVQLKNDEDTIALKNAQIKTATQEAEGETGRIKVWGHRVEALDTQRVTLTARLEGIPVHGQKQDLDMALETANGTARATLTLLHTALMAAGLLEQRARALISSAVPDAFATLKRSIETLASALEHTDFSRMQTARTTIVDILSEPQLNVARLYELSPVFDGMNQGIDSLYEALLGSDESVSLAVASEATGITQQKAEADKRVRNLSAQKSKLALGKVTYPHSAQMGIDFLNEQFPQANAQVLCDLVEPKSEAWQQAIEGYMDGARFNLIVDTAWEASCIDFLKAKNITAKVVQGAMCLKHSAGKVIGADSVVHELKSANPVAWAYLVEQFGPVVKVRDTEALRHTPRGLMQDGKASGGRTMFTCDYRERVFGQAARAATFARVTQELGDAEVEQAQLETMKGLLDKVKAALQGLKQPHFDANPLRDASSIIDKSRQALANLDLSEVVDLEKARKDIVEEIGLFNESIQAATRREGELDGAIKLARGVITGVEAHRQAHLDAFDAQIQKLKRVVEANPALTYPMMVEPIEARMFAGKVDLDAAKEEAKTLSTKPDYLLVGVRESLATYNSQARPEERFAIALQHRQENISFESNYAALVSLLHAVGKTLDGLRSIGLYNNRLELDDAERTFHDVFTKQFCVEIKSRVDDGIRTLRQMNHELKNLKFGSDSFSIDWSKWDPEFEDYLDFFEAVTKLADSAEQVDLFGETGLTEKHAAIRDRLVKLLLSDDHESAAKELLRIADYRNYRRYDIINDTASGGRVKLSEWGTGSGGQLETPAYIVRAAVVTNRLKMFEKGPSLKMLANDESFSKMDEPRARAVLGFLRDNLDLQVVSAMPTMKAGPLRDEFTREYSFTRLKPVANGELDFISDCDERSFKADKMRELWERQRIVAREKAKQLFDIAYPEQDPVAPGEPVPIEGAISNAITADALLEGTAS